MDLKELKTLYLPRKCGVKERLKAFKALGEVEQQKEFVFCLLTPQSNAQRCWEAVEQIFKTKNFEENHLSKILKSKSRFHNNKAKYVSEGLREWNKIRPNLKNEDIITLRNWLADNVKGYGLKEASHFLRNIGKSDNKIAILDRHILKNMKEARKIREVEIKGKKDYLEKEKKYIEFANSLKIPADELDLLLWSKENGQIFK